MAVAYFYENPEMTLELIAHAGELLNPQLGEQRRSGQLYHANGELEGEQHFQALSCSPGANGFSIGASS